MVHATMAPKSRVDNTPSLAIDVDDFINSAISRTPSVKARAAPGDVSLRWDSTLDSDVND